MTRLFAYFYATTLVIGALLHFAEAAITGADRINALKAHNTVRKNHKVNALSYSYALENQAKLTVDKCQLVHSGNSIYGQNMAVGFPTVTDAINAWYNESKAYDYNNPVFSYATGHFTQMVWKGTTIMGCYVGTCNIFFKGAQMIVCSYNKPGNIISSDNGFFKNNVFPP